MTIGATLNEDGTCRFEVWAPYKNKVMLKLLDEHNTLIPLVKNKNGYWIGDAVNIKSGQCYCFELDGEQCFADPASRWQPQGVLGPSAVLDQQFEWQDQYWKNIDLKDYIIYECHIGTFTQEGTFESAIKRLGHLKELGITAIELMPVSAFPGKRNWGYDAVFPYAVQESYGGPVELKKFVDAAHQVGLAVIVDVIYNHIGPEGNILQDFAPYFTNKYNTPWGSAINYDDEDAEGVRQFFIGNALYWFEEFHIDALRLDAIQTIFDKSPKHILAELSDTVHAKFESSIKQVHLIAESDLNAMHVTAPGSKNGWGLGANWCDDLHHALHAYFTNEKQGYYTDFGNWEQLVKTVKNGYWFDGQYCKHRKQKHGDFNDELDPMSLVIFGQNHDQIGNRLAGERLIYLVDMAKVKIVAALVLLSPHIPLLFMGEEYGETSPFLYFVDHYNEELLLGVKEGRKKEFAKFNWHLEPPDPGNPVTFQASRLDWNKLEKQPHHQLYEYYKKLISLRKQFKLNAVNQGMEHNVWEDAAKKIIVIRYSGFGKELAIIINMDEHHQDWSLDLDVVDWKKELYSNDNMWCGEAFDMPEDSCAGIKPLLEPFSVTIYSKG